MRAPRIQNRGDQSNQLSLIRRWERVGQTAAPTRAVGKGGRTAGQLTLRCESVAASVRSAAVGAAWTDPEEDSETRFRTFERRFGGQVYPFGRLWSF